MLFELQTVCVQNLRYFEFKQNLETGLAPFLNSN